MSDVVGTYARVRSAFEQPTLTLLYRPRAQLTVSLLMTCFGGQDRAVPVSVLHVRISNLLSDLRLEGIGGLPDVEGRTLCQAWVKGKWLNRPAVEPGDEEVYTLSSYARRALDLVASLGNERATLSDHRIATILNTVRNFNAMTNVSRAERIRLINEEIAKRVDERDRLLNESNAMPAPTADFLLNGYGEVLNLISGLPSDFKRVEESFEAIRRQVLEEFRTHEGPIGDTVGRYLQRARDLMSTTPEGRAFTGALQLLRDDDVRDQLQNDLTALVDNEYGRDILTDDDRAALSSVVTLIHQGMNAVLRQRAATTRALKNYLSTHDVAHDRELDETLRALDQEFSLWLARTGPRTRVPFDLLPQRANLESLPRRFYDPQRDAPPPPIDLDVPDDEPEETSVQDILAFGGPSLADLRQILADVLSQPDPDDPVTLAQVFNDLEPERRRPVEILGLLHLAAQDYLATQHEEATPTQADDVDSYYAVRPDGSTRTFYTSRIAVVGPPEPCSEDHGDIRGGEQ